jgi:hypothetical protein
LQLLGSFPEAAGSSATDPAPKRAMGQAASGMRHSSFREVASPAAPVPVCSIELGAVDVGGSFMEMTRRRWSHASPLHSSAFCRMAKEAVAPPCNLFVTTVVASSQRSLLTSFPLVHSIPPMSSPLTHHLHHNHKAASWSPPSRKHVAASMHLQTGPQVVLASPTPATSNSAILLPASVTLLHQPSWILKLQ